MSDTAPRHPDDPPADPHPDGPPDVFHDVFAAAESTAREERRVDTRARMGLSEALAELATISLADTSLTDVLRQVASLAQATIPGADEVSLTLLEGDRSATVAFTGDLAIQLDERQYEDGFGPCMHAARQGGTIPLFDLGPDGDAEQRYPEFVRAARRAGVTGTLSVGMPVPSRVVGGLNVYARGGDGGGSALDAESVAAAEAFAGYAAIAVANAGLVHSTRRFAEQMREAMVSRGVIEQAKGVLVARTGCTSEQAFSELARISSTQNRKLATVAADLVAEAQKRRGDPPPDDAAR